MNSLAAEFFPASHHAVIETRVGPATQGGLYESRSIHLLGAYPLLRPISAWYRNTLVQIPTSTRSEADFDYLCLSVLSDQRKNTFQSLQSFRILIMTVPVDINIDDDNRNYKMFLGNGNDNCDAKNVAKFDTKLQVSFDTSESWFLLEI